MKLFSAISSLFGEQDPKRFAGAVAYAPNFHGELAGARKDSTVYDRVRVDTGGHVTFTDQSAFSGIDIPSHLTQADIIWLRKKKLSPENPAYEKAKAYFAQNPTCDKRDLAQASGIGEETAKDVIAGFRYNILNPSPTT